MNHETIAKAEAARLILDIEANDQNGDHLGEDDYHTIYDAVVTTGLCEFNGEPLDKLPALFSLSDNEIAVLMSDTKRSILHAMDCAWALEEDGEQDAINHPVKTDDLEQYSCVALNLHHLTEDDARCLREAVAEGDNSVLEREYGFFIKLLDEDSPRNLRHGHSDALKEIIRWAHSVGHLMIEFDLDVDAIDLFPTFEW